MNFRSMSSNLRRVLTLLVVFAVVLVTLPLQANAQEWSTTSTTAYETADEGDWATESTSEPVEQPSATSKASKTSAARPDDYTEEPTLTEEAIEPFDELAETLWPSETEVPGDLLPEGHFIAGEIEAEDVIPGIAEVDPVNEVMFSPRAFRSAFSMFSTASDYYNPTPASDVKNFWAHRNRVENPAVAQRCGLNVALVFDVSNSIENIGGLPASKQAGRTVVEALRGASGTKLGIFNFDTDSLTMHEGYDMVTQPNQAINTINSLRIAHNGTGGTNWEGGLKRVNDSSIKYDVVYFITDGVPTTNNSKNPTNDLGYNTHNQDIYKAIDQANTLKSKGTRLEVLAVGMDSSKHNVLKDTVGRVNTNTLGALANYDTTRDGYRLNTSNPNFSWNVFSANWTDQLVRENVLLQNGNNKALAGADVTAARQTGLWYRVNYSRDDYILPQYELDQPTGRQIALSLTSDVTDVTNYDELERQLTRMLPAPCLANVVVKKNVVDQFGNKDSSVSLKDWEFEFGKLPSGFTYQSGYQSKVKTDNNGRAEWRFNTSTPNENGKVDITELVKANVDSQLQKVVCTDRQDAEIPVEVNGQKFSIKMVAGQTYTCEVVNQIPGFEVSKRAAADQNPDIEGDQPVAGVKADGSFTAFYHIDVQNLSKSQNTLTKRVVDTLVYPEGFTANEVIFTMNGNRVNATYRNGSYEIAATAFTRFNANETKTIDVEVRGTANDAARQSLNDDTYVGCEASGGSKTGGLLNKVSMEGDKDKTNNEACVDVTVLDVLLKLLKVDHNNVNQALTGAEFALYTAVNGQMGEKVTDFTVGGADGSHETRIAVGGEYFIVETKAPDSYSLLPAPVHIRVDTVADGSLDLVVVNPNEAFSAEPKESDDSKYVILQVADLQSGALPKSGGMGVVPFAVVALLILGLGALMLRRRM
ncbi:MAG: VWA domain-containing protein [Corynebacterium casei]